MIFVTWMSVQSGGSGDEEVNWTWKLAIVQLLAQNIYAALFLPALLLFRHPVQATATAIQACGRGGGSGRQGRPVLRRCLGGDINWIGK